MATRPSRLLNQLAERDNERVRRTGVALVLAAASLAVSCTRSAPSPATAGTTPSAASSPYRLGVHARCPVTRPMPHAPAPASPPLPVPYIRGWYGNTGLWVGVPTGGVLPAEHSAGTPSPHEWLTKFPWWRAIAGTLTITARRLDGPSAGFHAEVPGGYGRIGFAPSDLIWPAPGCWQVTGTVAGRSLTFITLVQAVHS